MVFGITSERAINRLEKILLKDSMVLLSNSFEDYSNKNNDFRSTRKRRLQYIYCAIGWLTFLRFSFAAFVRDSKILVAIGDPFYLTENQVLFNLLVASIALNSSLFRTIFLFGERKHILYFIDQFYCLQRGSNHDLSQKIVPYIATISFGLLVASYMMWAFLKNDYPFNAFLCTVWVILIGLSGWLMASIQCMTYCLMFLTSYYLKIRFEQISQIKINTIKSMTRMIGQHNSITNLTQNYNKIFSKLMAVNYFVATIVCNLFAYIGIYGNGNIYFRSIVGSQTFYAFLLIYSSVYTSASIASAAFLPYNTVYWMIASKRKMTFRQKWKVFNFLENLSERVIGIYCYDLFPFTNYEFGRYVCGVVIIQFLFIGLIRNYGIN